MGYEIMHSYRIKEFRNLHIANKVTHLAIVTIVVNRGVSFFFSFLFWLELLVAKRSELDRFKGRSFKVGRKSVLPSCSRGEFHLNIESRISNGFLC